MSTESPHSRKPNTMPWLAVFAVSAILLTLASPIHHEARPHPRAAPLGYQQMWDMQTVASRVFWTLTAVIVAAVAIAAFGGQFREDPSVRYGTKTLVLAALCAAGFTYNCVLYWCIMQVGK